MRWKILAILNWIWKPEKPQAQPSHIVVDPRPYTISTYEPPSPTTYGKIAVAQAPHTNEPSRASQAQLDAMIRHEIRMSQAHRRAVIDTEPRTKIIPTMPKMHKLNLVSESEPPPGSTLYETPAFLEDQSKRVS